MNLINLKNWSLSEKFAGGLATFSILVLLLNYANLNHKAPTPEPKTQAQIEEEKKSAEMQAIVEKLRAEKVASDLEIWKKTPAGKICTAHPNWEKKDCDLIADKSIAIHMNMEMVRLAIGRPDRINKTTNSRTSSEQWVYGDDYVYFDDGFVSTVQQSE